MIRVLAINYTDSHGSRFNGFEYIEDFKNLGIDYRLYVDNKQSKSKNVYTLKGKLLFQILRKAIRKFEYRIGVQSRFYLWHFQLLVRPVFWRADIIHLHIIHNEYFPLSLVKLICKIKPTVWTHHDLWIVTGHCIQPIDCTNWQKNCGNCPDLKRTIPVGVDRTQYNKKYKINLLQKIRCTHIVSTEWLRERIKIAYPFITDIQVIPFGLDFEYWSNVEKSLQLECINKIDLDSDIFTVVVRGSTDPIKGYKDLLDALMNLPAKMKINLICVGTFSSDFLSEVQSENIKIIRMPWISSEDLRIVLAISDLSIVASRAESFNMMALESMAAGVPVLERSNIATNELTKSKFPFRFESEYGPSDIVNCLMRLMDDKDALQIEADRVQNIAKNRFTIKNHLNDLIFIYQNILAKQ